MAEIIYLIQGENGVSVTQDDAAQAIKIALTPAMVAAINGAAANGNGGNSSAIDALNQQIASLGLAVAELSSFESIANPAIAQLLAAYNGIAPKLAALADPAAFRMENSPMQAFGSPFKGYTSKSLDTAAGANAVTGEYTVPAGWGGIWSIEAEFQVSQASLSNGVANVIPWVNGSAIGAGRTVIHGGGELYSHTDLELQPGDKVAFVYQSGPAGANGRCFRFSGRWVHAKHI